MGSGVASGSGEASGLEEVSGFAASSAFLSVAGRSVGFAVGPGVDLVVNVTAVYLGRSRSVFLALPPFRFQRLAATITTSSQNHQRRKSDLRLRLGFSVGYSSGMVCRAGYSGKGTDVRAGAAERAGLAPVGSPHSEQKRLPSASSAPQFLQYAMI